MIRRNKVRWCVSTLSAGALVVWGFLGSSAFCWGRTDVEPVNPAPAAEESVQPESSAPDVAPVNAVPADAAAENSGSEAPQPEGSLEGNEDAALTIAPSENPNAPDARVEFSNIEIEEESEKAAETTVVPVPEKTPQVPQADAPVEGLTMPPENKETESADSAPLYELYKTPDVELNSHFGFPTPQDALREMYDDVVSGVNTRRVGSYYQQWRRYAAGVLARTNKLSTGLELNNRCRLSWYEQLYRDPVTSVFHVEAFSRELYADFSAGAYGMIRGLRQARAKMDLEEVASAPEFIAPKSPQQAVQAISMVLSQAAESHALALAPLTPAETKLLTRESFTVFCAQTHYGHMVASVGRAKYLVDLMEKMDKAAMYDAAESMMTLLDARFLEQLKAIKPDMFETVQIGDNKCQQIVTPAGNIVIGGPEDNVWDLDNMENLACLIDLGGSDTYKEGVCSPDRPLLMLIDLGAGNDRYEGTRPGIQGGSILGVSILYNEQGDNLYQARDIAQGATVGGVGVLVDCAGNDRYLAFKRVQGCALEGFGALIDRGGNDDYHAALLAQGLGNPRGFGLLLDQSGDDHYYVGGFYEDSYPEHPGYDGWGQGIGCGLRGVACGGIGVLLEGDGDDTYEFDYFGHGGGYWMGLGFLRDFGGNDTRVGATLKSYTNGNRSQARWQRFSNGFGCHYALGFLFDDSGNDRYNGTIMGLGMAWDLSAGFLVDFEGDDAYEATGGLTQGTGAEGSLGFLFDYRGADNYSGRGQGYSSGQITYHQASDCGANFSFVVDHGGEDKYGCGAKNNMMSQRGMATGFIIDRPTEEELNVMRDRGEDVSKIIHETEQRSQGQMIDNSLEQIQRGFSDSMNDRPSDRGGFFRRR